MKKSLLTTAILAISLSLFAQTREQILATMKKATTAFDQKVGVNGAYVWHYLPDMSRRWGEAEAYPTMGWVEGPGVSAMGNVFLDLYIATGDKYYWSLAEKSAKALIYGQLDNGGWNFFFNFAGDTSTARWYNTIGKQAWRMEEFHHFYKSATYDDYVHGDAAKFLLRMFLQKRHDTYLIPLLKAINLILVSQTKSGGWPERYPLEANSYTSQITLNDDVTLTNILFLIDCYRTRVAYTPEVRAAITYGMNAILALQNGQPAPGWARQFYTETMKPAPARTYEPIAINTSFTAEKINAMMDFYRLTGETKFLSRLEEAIDWLESLAMTEEEIAIAGRTPSRTSITVPRNLRPTTNKPMYTHRRGSNIATGYYFHNDDPRNTIGHMSSFATVNIRRLRADLAEVQKLCREEIKRTSPLLSETPVPLQKFYSPTTLRYSREDRTVSEIISNLNSDGFWITPLPFISYVYKPIPQSLFDAGKRTDITEFATTQVGDEYDTSPFPPNQPVMGISTSVFITNMARLIEFLENL